MLNLLTMQQVWAQMVDKDCYLGILSSSNTTIFLARGSGPTAQHTLFISPSFSQDDCTLLAAYCWMSLALGKLDMSNLNLPEVNTTWWMADKTLVRIPRNPGFVMS